MLSLLAAALLATSPAPARSPEVQALVARCLAAHGGPAALEKTARQQVIGSVTSLLHPGVTGRMGRIYERAGRLRVEVQWPDGDGEIRVVDGARGWRQGQAVEGAYLASMRLQAARMDLPGLLSARDARLEDLGTRKIDGRALRVLALVVGPGLVVEAGIDPATARLVHSHGYAQGQAKVEFTTAYEDYREVDGVLVAFREVNWANGRTTGETLVEQASFPAALPAEMFGP